MVNTQNYEAEQGAGIQTAMNILEGGATAVISGLCGPNAYKVLTKAGATLFYKKGGTVTEALEDLAHDRLSRADEANIEGHWV
jgi:predicted Fe-Mo cluster-binding NifX family protein